MGVEWTPELTETARRLYVDDDLSADAVAKRLGLTDGRNAVLGKMQRSGFVKGRAVAKEKPDRLFKEPLRRGPVRVRPFIPVSAVPALTAAKNSAPRLWLTVRHGECRWPIGEPTEPGHQLMCCAPTDGELYCCEHRARAYLPTPPLSLERLLVRYLGL